MKLLKLARQSLFACSLFVAGSARAQVNPLDPPARNPLDNPLDPAPTPAPGPQTPLIPAGPRPGEVAPAAAQLPAFVKPGMRWYYHEGESIVNNVPWHLIPNAAGGWKGQANNNQGQVWYLAIDLLGASPQFIAANARKYVISDVARGTTTAAGGKALTGDANTFDKYWISPARLAQIEAQRANGMTINRVRFVVGDKTYNALSMMEHNERTYVSQIYDLESGILLSSSSADRNAPVLVPNGQGGIMPAQGATMITHSRFMGMRELKIPWAAAPLPAWVAKGQTIQYTGSYGNVGPMGQNHLALNRACKITRVTEGVAIVDSVTRRDQGGLPANDALDTQAFGSAQVNAWFISPRALQALRPNTVIDDDRVTHFRTTFVGIQGNFAIFLEEGPVDRAEAAYDMQSGLLASVRARQQLDPSVGAFVSEIRVVAPR